MTNIIKTWNETNIRWRENDQYGCLTDMAHATGKRVNDWLRLGGTEEYLEALSAATGIPATEAVQVIQGGTPEIQGTWAHRRICLRFAQWCSPEFAVQVDTWVEELMSTGSVSLTLPKDFLSALKALVASEEQKLELAAKNEILEAQAGFYAGKLGEAEDVLQAYRAITSDDSCLSLKQVADALAIQGLGRNNLSRYLRKKSFLTQNHPVPYRRVIEAEWAIVVTSTYEDNYGNIRSNQSTRFTFKGLVWLVKTLKKDGYDVRATAEQIWDTYNVESTDVAELLPETEDDLATLEDISN